MSSLSAGLSHAFGILLSTRNAIALAQALECPAAENNMYECRKKSIQEALNLSVLRCLVLKPEFAEEKF